jgi:hypothetical protein
LGTWQHVTERKRWDALLARSERCALQQAWSYGEAIAARGHGVRRLQLIDAGEPVALAQVILRRLPFGIDFGLLMRGPAWLCSMDDQAREGGAVASMRCCLSRSLLIWQPDDGAADDCRAGCRRVWTGPSTVLLNLDQPLDTLRRQLKGKWRNMLTKAETARLRLRDVSAGPRLDWLLEASDRQRRTVGYHGPSAEFLRAMQGGGAPKAGQALLALVACQRHDEPLAGIVVARHGRSATYYVGVTTPAGRRLNAHHLLLWSAIGRLRDEGCTTLDLGGVDTVRGPGIARFKLGMGGAPLTLAGSYLLPWRWR